MTNSDIIKIAEYSEIGRRLIDELFEEFYQNDKKNQSEITFFQYRKIVDQED